MTHRIHGLTFPSDPTLSPDGTRVAFTVTRIDSDTDANVRQLWVHDRQGTRPFTAGESDLTPPVVTGRLPYRLPPHVRADRPARRDPRRRW